MTFGEELELLFISKPLRLLYRLSFLEATPGECLTIRGLRWPLCTRLTADRQAAHEVAELAGRLTAQKRADVTLARTEGFANGRTEGFANGHRAGWLAAMDHVLDTLSRNSAERSAAEARADDETS